MAIIKGGDLMLFLNKEAAGSTKENPKYEKVSIGYATSHSLSISADTKETSTKDSGGKWQTSEVGIISWTASSENLYANDAQGFGYSDLFDIMVSRTPIDAVFGVEGNSKNLEADKKDNVPTGGWTIDPRTADTDGVKRFPRYEGKVIITSIELNAPNGEDASFTVQFQGTGALKKVEA